MAVISISRQFGSGGKTLGDQVAKRLNYHFVDRGIITKVAKEANVSIDWVVAVERETSGHLMQILSRVVSGDFIQRHLADKKHDFDEKKYINFLKKVITDIAQEGNVVILGRGSQFILPEEPGIFKILLVAPEEWRINFLIRRYNITRKESETLVNREERKRFSFLYKLDQRPPDDPIHYHMCLDTSRVGLDLAEELVVRLIADYESTKK